MAELALALHQEGMLFANSCSKLFRLGTVLTIFRVNFEITFL